MRRLLSLAHPARFVPMLVLASIAGNVGSALAAEPNVRVVSDSRGRLLEVDGEPLMVFGMNWDYFPIGTNYSFDIWSQPDDVIIDALGRDMPLLQDMGVNAIRVYAGMPPRWVKYVYETYGIYTILNHPCARYGYTLDGAWIPNVDYSSRKLRDAVKNEVVELVKSFADTPGILTWLLGNENNYGLHWTSFEIEALPEEHDTARARQLYSFFEEIAAAIKEVDTGERPVTLCNGDIQYIDVIAEECRSIDIFGTNVYRGISVRDLYDEVEEKCGLPVMFTEFGADAWNARDMREDPVPQARWLCGQWQEIYEQSHGKGRVGNSIGGLIFQWTDGWWKFRQEENLDVHDTNASWPNGGYPWDYVEGENNMNEEWWGITAKGPTDHRGLYDVYPRAAYYALRRAFTLDPYAPTTTLERIREHFAVINPVAASLEARGGEAVQRASALSKARISGVRIELETFNTGGERVSTPEIAPSTPSGFPAFRGFDRMQSFFVEAEATPTERLRGSFAVSVLGDVPTNPIDEIFYENRGRPVTFGPDDGLISLEDVERVKVYQAELAWDDRWFTLDGFYRTGHLHWQYEGDFFGLYRDAYYGENIDIYNGLAPVGVEIDFKRSLGGLTVAFGPELWWGANPSVMAKLQRRVAGLDVTVVGQEDISQQRRVESTFAVPVPENRKVSLQAVRTQGPFTIEAGGLWSGSTKLDDPFQVHDDTSGEDRVLQDSVRVEDTFGGKLKITYQKGRMNWYAQGALMGLVADGGPTAIPTFTGWHLKDSGSGNQANLLTGFAVTTGRFQLAPNFLYQKPLVGPIPDRDELPDDDFFNLAIKRNVLDHPFAVLGNRETIGGEFLVTYDPTPATWMYQWDNDVRENAGLAVSAGYVFRHFPTTRDAHIFILANGDPAGFPGAPAAHDEWEIHARVVSHMAPGRRLVMSGFFGEAIEARSESERLLTRGGGHARFITGPVSIESFAKFNDWGPYDYHRDFNLTFPVQLMGDLSYSFGAPAWFGLPNTRIGVRGNYRTLDENSPRFCPDVVPDVEGNLACDPTAPGDDGYEWEIRTYLHLSL